MEQPKMDDHQIRATIIFSSMTVMFGFSIMLTLVGLEIPSGLIVLLGTTMTVMAVGAMIGLGVLEVLRIRRLVRQAAATAEHGSAGPDR